MDDRHAGHHDHDLAVRSRLVDRWLIVAVAVVAAATVVGLVALWPRGPRPATPAAAQSATFVDATALSVEEVPCDGVPESTGIRCRDVRFRVTSGPRKGDEATLPQTATDASAPRIEPGDRIVLGYVPGAPEGFGYYFVDYQRRTPLLLLAACFAVAVVALGRWQGVRALLGLALSMGVLAVFLLPALLRGTTPLGAALVAASVVAFGALYLAHGINRAVTVALLGTLAALGLTAGLGALFSALTRLTGLSDENVLVLQAVGGDVDPRGLVLAGIIIGTLGVLDDVTVTQVSAVAELAGTDPDLSWHQLYRKAIRIGRDHIASTVNTLVLAYAGAALPLLLLFVQGARPISRVLTGEIVAIEIVRTLVGSIGLIAAVPMTTALAAFVAARPGPADPDEPAVPGYEGWEPIDWDDTSPVVDP